jgi:hypothetical protein
LLLELQPKLVVYLHVVLLLDLGVLVDALNQLYEVRALLGPPAWLDQPQALLHLLLQIGVDVVAALAVLHEGQLHHPHSLLVRLDKGLFIEIAEHLEEP